MQIVFRFLSILLIIAFANSVQAEALIGEISKEDFKIKRPQVIDESTKMPISGAKVSLPTENKFDYTNSDGYFKLMPESKKPVILSIQKEGYRPFSQTLYDGRLTSDFELKKLTPLQIIVSDDFLHLGDDSYSENSAGACLINSPCVGPSFSKNFHVGNINPKTKCYVVVGSVIGIDTLQAMRLGQNNLTNAFSSPVEIFVNKTKIGELKINGDNQRIPVPNKILLANSDNVLSVKTGKNQNANGNIDYDDIELMNLIVDIKN